MENRTADTGPRTVSRDTELGVAAVMRAAVPKLGSQSAHGILALRIHTGFTGERSCMPTSTGGGVETGGSQVKVSLDCIGVSASKTKANY